jgi:hypothetical protein
MDESLPRFAKCPELLRLLEQEGIYLITVDNASRLPLAESRQVHEM